MSTDAVLLQRGSGYHKRKEQPIRVNFMDEFASSVPSTKCSSTLYEQHKQPGQFLRDSMKSFKKTKNNDSKKSFKIDLTSEPASCSPESVTSSSSLPPASDSIALIMSEAKSSLNPATQSSLSQSDQFHGSPLESPSQACGYVKAVCSRSHCSPKQNFPLKHVSSKQHLGMCNKFDDCDLGFESESANFKSSIGIDVEYNDTAAAGLAPIQLFELQQKKSLEVATVSDTCNDTVSCDKEGVSALRLDVDTVSSDDLAYSKRKRNYDNKADLATLSLKSNLHCCTAVTSHGTNSSSLCGAEYNLPVKPRYADHPNPYSQKKHTARLRTKKVHFSSTSLNSVPSLSKKEFTFVVPSEDMCTSDNTTRKEVISKRDNVRTPQDVTRRHGSKELIRSPLHSVRISEDGLPLNVTGVLKQHGAQPKVPKQTIPLPDKCPSHVHPSRNLNLDVCSMQVGKLHIERSFNLEVNSECMCLLCTSGDPELQFNILLNNVELWKVNFDEGPVIAIQLQSRAFSRITSYVAAKYDLDESSLHSTSDYISARYIVLKLQKSLSSTKRSSFFKILQEVESQSNHLGWEVLRMSPIEAQEFLESIKPHTCTPAKKFMCELPMSGDEELFKRPRRTTRSSTRTFYNKRNSTKKENRLVLMYKPPGSKVSLEVTTLDMESLAPEEYVNDKIMDFYLNYLLYEKLSEEQRSHVHIFSTFFYTRLSNTTLDNKQLSTPERIHNRVKNWTRHVDIFDKRFVIFPVCDRAHWFVAIVCSPGDYIPVSPKPRKSCSARATKRRTTIKRKRKGVKTDVESVKEANTEDDHDNIKPTSYELSSMEEESGYCPDHCSQEVSVVEMSETQQDLCTVNCVTDELDSMADESSKGFVSSIQSDDVDILDSMDSEIHVPANQEVTKTSYAMGDYVDMYFEETSTVDEKVVVKLEQEEVHSKEDISPCVMVLDSLGIRRPTASRRIRNYLTMEWKLRKADQEEKVFDSLPVKYPKIPLQDNSSDCGIFVLQFVESLLLSLSERNSLPTSEERWASYDEMRVKRGDIKRIIMHLSKKQV